MNNFNHTNIREAAKRLLDNQTILITGGTGSFGSEFVSRVLSLSNTVRLIIYSRDEMKQWEMSNVYKACKRVEFIIGDVRDRAALALALDGVNLVVHAAATKIIPTAEYNPVECIKTNINGAINIIDACRNSNVRKVVALSTDKACNPVNLYGATKLASDKLFIASTRPKGKDYPIFSIVRYGNVMGSRGSIIPYFLSMRNSTEVPITDIRMTRFMITLEHAVNMVLLAFKEMKGGEIFVPKIPSIKVVEIAKALAPKADFKIVGIRPGEKLHEEMISSDDSRATYEYDDHYRIFPTIFDIYNDSNRTEPGRLVPEGFSYISNKNNDWMTASNLLKLVESGSINSVK